MPGKRAHAYARYFNRLATLGLGEDEGTGELLEGCRSRPSSRSRESALTYRQRFGPVGPDCSVLFGSLKKWLARSSFIGKCTAGHYMKGRLPNGPFGLTFRHHPRF